jgi:hypothetical protein
LLLVGSSGNNAKIVRLAKTNQRAMHRDLVHHTVTVQLQLEAWGDTAGVILIGKPMRVCFSAFSQSEFEI